MGEDCGSWLPQQHFDWQSPNLDSLRATQPSLHSGQQDTISAYMNPCTNMLTPNGTLPVCAFPELPQSWAAHTNEPHGWFYCLPRFRQAFAPASNPIFKEKLPASAYENCRDAIKPNAGSTCAQKRFLVFDQSGDQTTLIFSPGIGAPVHCLTSWGPKPPGAYNLNGEDLGTKRNPIHHSGPILTDEFNENHGTDVGSEMHEDTEELNALLYSDDDSDYTEDDEVTSTGHSPSTMTAQVKQDWFGGGITEEVASSDGPTKRRKLFDGGFHVLPSLMDTASSVKQKRSSEYEDDAESSCGNGKNPRSGENDSLSGNKRTRKERIRETVSILQSIIPGGEGKDAIMVLDEAIHYLKSLKLKAKALGLDTL
ncbi:hypothetical protein L1049_025545 [Liquidambar formosana]|uniref:BHLH domain-containing protein n=1 Tax=Liquidambar formosana TaxID=63359 RepID=A0AAP0NB37_LIQFO